MQAASNNKQARGPGTKQVRRPGPITAAATTKPTKELAELDRIAKMLVRRDLELSEMREQREEELQQQARRAQELDKIAKMLIRRDLALSEMKERREGELKELERRTRELEQGRRALMNILEDVDEERKRAEWERDKTTAILRNFVDGLLLIERGRVSFLNTKAREFFGLEEGEGIGRDLAELSRHSSLGRLVKMLKAEKVPLQRAVLELSENLVLHVSAVPVRHREQEIGQMIILHNVTRERFIERMKTEFVSIAAHQLRTPLSAVKWILRMILDGDLGEVPQSQREFLEKTYQSNERMIKLVNDLLNVTRIEEGRFLYKVKPEDIVQAIEKTLTPLREMAERKGLVFEYKKPGQIPKVKVDAEKIGLAVQNLVDNAVRYTKQGSVKVAVEFSKDKNTVLFSVKDTGIGIPESQKRRVFDRFFRSSTAIRTETEGTGLGLFIAKNIVEAHGGKIWFESTEHKGSTFFFALPLGEREEFEKFIEGF